jgi:DNA-binding NarL/FixJ family response regulator
MARIVIVDDHQILVDILKIVLENEPDLEFVGAAHDLSSARELMQHTMTDILLLEVQLPDGNGFDLLPTIRRINPSTRIVVLTSAIDDITIMRALDNDVQGLLYKTCSLEELLATIRKVDQGDISIASELLLRALKRQQRSKVILEDNHRTWVCLTTREMEVLHCLASGKSGDRIATELNIAPFTVRTHIRNLMSKLGAHTRLEAVSFALTHGLIQAPH